MSSSVSSIKAELRVDPHKDEEAFDNELVDYCVKGDPEAFDYIRRLFYALHQWDDVHDQDVSVSAETIDLGLFDLSLVLPHHSFARRHPSIHPVLVNATINWMSANRLEDLGDERSLEVAYLLRCMYLTVLQYAAYLIGGPKWSLEAGDRIWGQPFAERLDVYMEEHGVRRRK